MDRYLSPDQVCELIPGMTTSRLAQMRFNGNGPKFRKPTHRTIVYVESEVREWLDSTARVRTDVPA